MLPSAASQKAPAKPPTSNPRTDAPTLADITAAAACSTASAADELELTMTDYAAAAAAFDRKMRAEVMPLLPPAPVEELQQLPAALLKKNAADRSAALAARAAANADRPRLTPEERAAALARSPAAAAARVSRLAASDAKAGATAEQCIEKAMRFQDEQAAPRASDVLDVVEQQMLKMPFEEAFALLIAQHHELAPKQLLKTNK
jgi:hypothetical protein